MAELVGRIVFSEAPDMSAVSLQCIATDCRWNRVGNGGMYCGLKALIIRQGGRCGSYEVKGAGGQAGKEAGNE